VLTAAQPLDPEGDEHGAQRRVRRQEDGRDGKQRPRDGLRAQRPRPLGQVAGHGAEQATDIATALGLDADEFAARLVTALAALADTLAKDLAEPDWWRILDALLLVAAHPAAP
jgi:hypothetical protein